MGEWIGIGWSPGGLRYMAVGRIWTGGVWLWGGSYVGCVGRIWRGRGESSDRPRVPRYPHTSYPHFEDRLQRRWFILQRRHQVFSSENCLLQNPYVEIKLSQESCRKSWEFFGTSKSRFFGTSKLRTFWYLKVENFLAPQSWECFGTSKLRIVCTSKLISEILQNWFLIELFSLECYDACVSWEDGCFISLSLGSECQ